jgi:hypothetical protein
MNKHNRHRLRNAGLALGYLIVLVVLASAGACDSPKAGVDAGTDDICPAGTTDCDTDGTCETDITEPANCGGCNIICPAGPHANAMCSLGRCGITCEDGWGDCDADPVNGCESDLTQPGTCGSCGNSCGGACVEGVCETCDSALPLDSADPLDAAKALGLCGDSVVSAKWTMADGAEPPVTMDDPSTPLNEDVFGLGRGILTGFGPNVMPREGAQVVAISSGTARRPADPDFAMFGLDKQYFGAPPFGFPKESPSCGSVITGAPHDAIALELVLKAPDWAKGFAFDFDFYTNEWPVYVCSQFNDFFVSILEPKPAGQLDGNISFDPLGNPISVNAAFVSVCNCAGGPPCTAGQSGTPKTYTCERGSDELIGNGFGVDHDGQDHAATSWLTTTAPVEPGSTITLRLAIYDSGDGALDSTTLLDKFRWLPKSPVITTQPIP